MREPYPLTEVREEHGAVLTSVGDATVKRTGLELSVERGSGINLLRAGAAAIWSAPAAIYALEVPPELYS